MKRLKLWLVLQLLAVFASGALVGALGYRYYDNRQEAVEAKLKQPKGGPGGFRRQYIQAMRDRLRLSEAQVQQLTEIMEESRRRFQQLDAETRKLMEPEMQAIQKDQRARIEAILDEAQRAEYHKMLEERRIEMEKRRRELEKNQGPQGQPPGGPK